MLKQNNFEDSKIDWLSLSSSFHRYPRAVSAIQAKPFPLWKPVNNGVRGYLELFMIWTLPLCLKVQSIAQKKYQNRTEWDWPEPNCWSIYEPAFCSPVAGFLFWKILWDHKKTSFNWLQPLIWSLIHQFLPGLRFHCLPTVKPLITHTAFVDTHLHLHNQPIYPSPCHKLTKDPLDSIPMHKAKVLQELRNSLNCKQDVRASAERGVHEWADCFQIRDIVHLPSF